MDLVFAFWMLVSGRSYRRGEKDHLRKAVFGTPKIKTKIRANLTLQFRQMWKREVRDPRGWSLRGYGMGMVTWRPPEDWRMVTSSAHHSLSTFMSVSGGSGLAPNSPS